VIRLPDLATCTGATRNRAISATVTLAYVAAAACLVRDSSDRASLHYTIVITLGYGHLVGAFVATRTARPGSPPTTPASAPRTAPRERAVLRERCREAWRTHKADVLVASTLCFAFAAFTECAGVPVSLVLGLLAISTWHVAENDLALEDTYAAGCRSAPPRWTLDHQLAAVAVTAVILAASVVALGLEAGVPRLPSTDGAPAASVELPEVVVRSPDRHRMPSEASVLALRCITILVGAILVLRERSGRDEAIGLASIGAGVLLPDPHDGIAGPAFADVFALATGYHLVSWIVVTLDRPRGRGPGGPRILAATHLLPMLLAAMCSFDDSVVARWLRDAFFAPGPYLFWSVAHVAQTGWRRMRGHPPRVGQRGSIDAVGRGAEEEEAAPAVGEVDDTGEDGRVGPGSGPSHRSG